MATMATYKVPKVENENNVGGSHEENLFDWNFILIE